MSQSTVGRPPVFTPFASKAVARLIKTNGLTGTAEILASQGVQTKPGGARVKVKVSLPTLSRLAGRANITLKRGRPALAA